MKKTCGCYAYGLSYLIWVYMCFLISCILHEEGIKKRGEWAFANGVKSGLLISRRAAALKIPCFG